MFIINNIAAGIIKLLSLLPFRLLYIKADVLCFLMYHVVGYRKKVVYTNLRNSFPEKEEREIRKIAKTFYHNLADVIIEQIKAISISEAAAKKRMIIRNTDVFEKIKKENKSVIGMIGHIGNWEWVGTFSYLLIPYTTYSLYKTLSNKFFDTFQYNIRTRFGLKLVPSKQAMRHYIKTKEDLTFTLMAADQTPIKSEIQYWTSFLNQDTGVFTGAEKVARSMGHAVVYIDIIRLKRGYYELKITEICRDAKKLKEHEITNEYMRLLENSIQQQPASWLWSHRRWKHKRD
jgi:KDO2-lipid IV(A) lauroyltransferase